MKNGQTLKRVFVAGHKGMVGSALCRLLTKNNSVELVLRDRNQLDLGNQSAVASFFATENIDEVYLAAAKVGGIHANNTYPAEFIFDNLQIQTNVIGAAYQAGVKKLLFLGSSCIYPKNANQPMTEDQLLTRELEPTNEPYAIAKIAGIKLCESFRRQYGVDYRSVMPTNLYGPGDSFHPENSHVVPALFRRFHDAVKRGDQSVVIWGSGNPKREFLHVDDMAAACLHVMNLPRQTYNSVITERCSHLNVGTGADCSIRELAELIAIISGFKGALEFDTSRPDGALRKLLDVTRLHRLGWTYSISIEEGLASAYQWYVENDSHS